MAVGAEEKEYQLRLLQYLTQSKQASKIISHIGEDVFSPGLNQVLLTILKAYTKKFGGNPHKTDFLHFVQIQLDNSEGVTEAQRLAVLDSVDKLFKPIEGTSQYLRTWVQDYVQQRQTLNLLGDYANRVASESGATLAPQLLKDVQTIAKLGELLERNPEEDLFLLKDFGRIKLHEDEKRLITTHLQGLNDFLSAGGFRPGEVALFAAGPKAGKTTLLVSLCKNMLVYGNRCLYVDTENGLQRIRTMLMKAIGEVNTQGLTAHYDRVVKAVQAINLYSANRGDVQIQTVSMGQGTVEDIRVRLTELKEEKGWKPTVVFVDYPDNLQPTDRGRDTWENLRRVFGELKRLAKDFGLVVFAVSQTNRKAHKKDKVAGDEVAGDFMKLGNADFVFGYSRTEEEKAANTGRIYPIAMRDGIDYGEVYLSVIPEKVKIEEITNLHLKLKTEEAQAGQLKTNKTDV